jgi:hypothetical protein
VLMPLEVVNHASKEARELEASLVDAVKEA